MATLAANTSGQISALEMPATTAFNLGYEQAAAAAELWYQRFVSELGDPQKDIRWYLAANNLSFNYGLIGDAPTFRNVFVRQSTTRVKQWWLDGVQMHETDMGNPNWDKLILDKIGNFGGMAAYMAHARFVEALRFGDTDPIWTTYDGAQLFSNTHTVGDGAAYDNLYAATPLTGANLQIIKSAMLKAPLGPGGAIMPSMRGTKFTLIVPLELEATARMILFNTVLPENSPISGSGATATENQYKGMMDLIVEPTLVDANDYYVIQSGGVAPFPSLLLQQTGMSGADRLVPPNLDDPQFYLDGMLKWGWKTYREYAFPGFQMMAKATN